MSGALGVELENEEGDGSLANNNMDSATTLANANSHNNSNNNNPKTRGAPNEAKLYKEKYKGIKKRSRDLEMVNQELMSKFKKAKKIIDRLKLERTFLLDKLEKMEYYSRLPTGPQQPATVDDEKSQKTKNQSSGILSSKKKDKSKQDPNAPRKPANAFFMFCTTIRDSVNEELKDKHKDSNHYDVTKELGARWKSLSKEERSKFYAMYEQDKVRYEKEMGLYTRGEFVKPPNMTGDMDVDPKLTAVENIDDAAAASDGGSSVDLSPLDAQHVVSN
eukprot:Sdes_comp16149_c0_seq1m5395